ncbi:hypothetical protein [Halosegnis sp.]|uniref:hypothetical protein n=1 Tax=Halosegnis sp. TaxID=2864959 RepID=UPI0035D419B0
MEVRDQLANAHYYLETPGKVTTREVDRETVLWPFPVETATEVTTDRVTTPQSMCVSVRTPDGTSCATVTIGTGSETVHSDGWLVAELWSTPLKLFIAAKGGLSVKSQADGADIQAVDSAHLYLGARSLHEQPARTITTPADPRPLMRAVSEFGSALKTLSCERSFPTLRGHPPTLDLGDELDIPDGPRAPKTGVTIEIPESLRAVYTVAPLAYYLGATVEPGTKPRLTTTTGVSYPLAAHGSLAESVRDLLRHVFTMDCLVRTEGGYCPVSLAERQAVDGLLSSVDETFASLYGKPIAEQLDSYLSVPFEEVEPVQPTWRHTADLPAGPAGVEVLPFLTADLATIRCYDPEEQPTRSAHIDPSAAHGEDATDAIDEFVRGLETTTVRSSFDQLTTRSDAPRDRGSEVSRDELFHIRDADTPVQTYVGDGFPIGANKASRASYERQLAARSTAGAQAEVLVICNDEEMLAERDVREEYGSFELLPKRVQVKTNLSQSALREVLSRDVDLLHYIGHVDSRGLQAADGYLDVGAIEKVGATAFILNGCRSFKQGSKLVEAGAVGGVVTLKRVHNSLATEMGRHIARLVDVGWPLDQAMSLLEADALIGESYAVVGDGSTELVANAATPTSAVIAPVDSGHRIRLTYYTHPTRSYNVGSLYQPPTGTDDYYLSGGEIDTFVREAEEVDGIFTQAKFPIKLETEQGGTALSLRWSDDLAGNLSTLNQADGDRTSGTDGTDDANSGFS